KFYQRIVHAGSALGGQKCNSPSCKQRLLQRVRRGHEYERARTIILVTRSFPGLPDIMQQQANVGVRHAVANKQDGAAQSVRAKLDVQRGVERQPVQKIGLGEDQRRIVIEIAMVFYNMCNPLGGVRNLLGVRDLCIRSVVDLERRFQVTVIVCSVDGGEIEFDDELVKLRGGNAIGGDLPISIEPASQRAHAAVLQA